MTNHETLYAKHYADALARLKSGASPNELLAYVERIGDEDYRDGTIAKLARLFATKGQAQEAVRFCEAIRDPLEHADALFSVAAEIRKTGSIESAKLILYRVIQAAEKLKQDAWERPAIFLQISDELWMLGEKDQALHLLDRAIELAKRPPEHFENSKTLAGCARVLFRWGKRAEALAVATGIESKEQRTIVLKELV